CIAPDPRYARRATNAENTGGYGWKPRKRRATCGKAGIGPAVHQRDNGGNLKNINNPFQILRLDVVCRQFPHPGGRETLPLVKVRQGVVMSDVEGIRCGLVCAKRRRVLAIVLRLRVGKSCIELQTAREPAFQLKHYTVVPGVNRG